MNNLHLQDGKVAFRWSRWRNKKRQEVSYCLMVLFSGAVLLGAGSAAHAVIIASDTGVENTSAPPGLAYWANVGPRGIGTGIYLGNRWVLTAYHAGRKRV